MADTALVVLHRNADWLAVEKPSGTPTTAPERARVVSLVDRVRREIVRDDTVQPHPLSRLDVDVTGVVLFALTARARQLAVEARAGGTYARRYVGLVAHAPEPPEGVWTWTIGVDPRDRTLRVADGGRDPVPALTRYRVIERAGDLAMVQFDLETGRTHQIRVHAAHSGCPVLGDRTYGGPRHVTLPDGTVCTARRVMLHARAVRIPKSDRWIEAPFPPDWVNFWRAVGGV
ncbi:MAG: RluA family pseudouridine synthase [Deltaproteobacteria bacterium]